MTRILFVCTANICRSPMAEAVTRELARRAGLTDRALVLDSAGTHAQTVGPGIDPRAQAALERRGYRTARRRPRALRDRDVAEFDLLLAMGHDHRDALRRLAGGAGEAKTRLFLDLVPSLSGQDIPDPYFSNAQGFERVLDLCEAGARALLDSLQAPQ